MKTPNVIFKKGALSDITARRSALDTRSKVKQEVTDAVKEAEAQTKAGLDILNHILAPRRRREKIKRWRNNQAVVDFFGSKSVNPTQIRAVRRRLQRAHRRLAKRRLNIRLLPQSRASTSTQRGRNRGGPAGALRFSLFPEWFKAGDNQRAGVIVHELFHDWFIDHKIKQGGTRKTVRTAAEARSLAQSRPRAARRNPENYEQFCLTIG